MGRKTLEATKKGGFTIENENKEEMVKLCPKYFFILYIVARIYNLMYIKTDNI